jgi:hypothetical protein
MHALLLLLTIAAEPPAPVDWPALLQKPHAGLPVPDFGLHPLLVTMDGRQITTPAEWQKARHTLRETWLTHLGRAPDRPAELDIRIEETVEADGYNSFPRDARRIAYRWLDFWLHFTPTREEVGP